MELKDSDAKKRWDKENMLMLCFKLHRKNDPDIIEFLESKGNDKQKTIKIALREYIENHKGDTT